MTNEEREAQAFVRDENFQQLVTQIKGLLKSPGIGDLAEEIAIEMVKAPSANATDAEEEECFEGLWTARHRVITRALLAVAMGRMQ